MGETLAKVLKYVKFCSKIHLAFLMKVKGYKMENSLINIKQPLTEGKKKMSKVKKVVLFIILFIAVIIVSFVIYEIATVNNTYYIGEKNLQIPIFVYHDLVPDESQVEYDYMQTTVDIFENQITTLMKLGYKPITYQDLVDYKNGTKAIPKWSFIITFDDGYEGVYKYAFEIAKKYNIPMTSFAIDDKVGEPGYYTWEQAKEMHDSGLMSIYSHGYTHTKYDAESVDKLVTDTETAYQNLVTNLEDENLLKVFTYPYGLCTEDEKIALANKGFIQNLTDNKINTSENLNLYGLHRTYPLDDSAFKILLKIQYRAIKYR